MTRHGIGLRASSDTSRRRSAALMLAAMLTFMPACMSAPLPVEPHPDVTAPPQFSGSGTVRLKGRWWTTFQDEQLNQHIDQALSANRSLRAVWHAFRESCAIARRTGSARRPMVDLLADAAVDRGTGDLDDEELSIGGAVSYEVDLWGRLRAQHRDDVFEARASLEDFRTAAVSLTAEVARVWLRLLEAEMQVAVLSEQIASNQNILSLIEPRVAAQQLRSVDLLRQETLIESTRGDRVEAEADAATLRNQLAVLTGKAPGTIAPTGTMPALPTLPPLPNTGIPIERIRDRPDITAARFRIMAGDQELGAALRDRYPSLNIRAAMGSATGVFDGFITSFAAGLLAPIVDGGS